MSNVLKNIYSLLAVAILCTGFSPEALAQSAVHAETFRRISILEDGRIKPLDTFASNTLLRLSGKRTFEKQAGIKWMMRMLFDPLSTQDDGVFLINNPVIVESLGVTPKKRRRYSLNELKPGFSELNDMADKARQIEAKERDLVEQEVIRVYDNLQYYAALSRSLAFTIPHQDFTVTDPFTRSKLNLPADTDMFSYMDIASRAVQLQSATQYLEVKPRSSWNKRDIELITLAKNLFQWGVSYNSRVLKIIPPLTEKDPDWHSPWSVMSIGMRQSDIRSELIALNEMAKAYSKKDELRFDSAAKTFTESANRRANILGFKAVNRIPLELQFNQLKPFFWSLFGYWLCLFIFLADRAFSKGFLRSVGKVTLGLTIALHTVGILYRMAILQRPPVSTLYETFIFVALITALIGVLIEAVRKNWLGYAIAAIGGVSFLTIAHKFSMEGDTLTQLVAVLNSSFWLSTHVVTITIGYAAACVAGFIGHVYLLQLQLYPKDKQLHRSTLNILTGAIGFALITTFLGTNLGGIWADQSWGRFWGWDPKENGALLIVLWLAIVLHARIAKLFKGFGYALASTFTIIIVMWAWFGVNLLSVGLHSYGFTSGLARNLTIYFVIHMAIIITQVLLTFRKRNG